MLDIRISLAFNLVYSSSHRGSYSSYVQVSSPSSGFGKHIDLRKAISVRPNDGNLILCIETLLGCILLDCQM